MYELFEHTADVGLRIRAPDLETLYADAGRGLFAVIIENLADVRPVRSEHLGVSGTEPAYLLVDWLDELLFRFDTEQLVFVEFDVRLNEKGIEADVRGEPLDPDRHRLGLEVKAVTYHGLRVEQTDDGWLAEVILDI